MGHVFGTKLQGKIVEMTIVVGVNTTSKND